MPEELLAAAKDLGAKRVLPVHSGKFALARHDWDEPLKKVMENNKDNDLKILTPLIGEAVYFLDDNQKFTHWWERLE